jgi:hypothetical protein
MKLVIALLLVAAAAPSAEKQLASAFRTAFGKGASVVLKDQGPLRENVKYTPGELVDTSFGPVLLSPGEVLEPTHANWGKLAIIYLQPAGKGFTVVRRFVPAVQTGSFGKIVDWNVSRSMGALPIVTVNGAGNWQGYACSTATLIELTPAGPLQLAAIPMTYDNSGALGKTEKKLRQMSGRIDNVVPGQSFDVVYFGSAKDLTEHYVRRGNAYVLAAGKTRMKSC